MHRIARSSSLAAALIAALGACGEGSEAQQLATAGAGGGKPPCPSVSEIQAAVGFAVVSRPVPVDGCLYELSGDYAGVMVSLMYQPAARAENIYADIRRGIQGAKGPSAAPDKLTVGEGGWGYSSRGRKQAAAVSSGRVYHVDIEHNLFESLALPDQVAVRVIELGMRVAPGPGKAPPNSGAAASASASAPLDACTLATNEEVGRISETPAQFAQHWSAPASSFGGSHCDFEGGSIRVFQGKSAAASFESTLKLYKAEKAPRTAVSGIGDKAYFLIPFPDDQYRRLGLLAVHSGPSILQLILDAQPGEPIEATRPRLEELARLVLPRLP